MDDESKSVIERFCTIIFKSNNCFMKSGPHQITTKNHKPTVVIATDRL